MANIISCVNVEDFEKQHIVERLLEKFGHNSQLVHNLYNYIVNPTTCMKLLENSELQQAYEFSYNSKIEEAKKNKYAWKDDKSDLRAAIKNQASEEALNELLSNESFANRLVEAAIESYRASERSVTSVVLQDPKKNFRGSKAEAIAVNWMVNQVHIAYRQYESQTDSEGNIKTKIAQEVYNKTLELIRSRWMQLCQKDDNFFNSYWDALEDAADSNSIYDKCLEDGEFEPTKLREVNPDLFYEIQRRSIVDSLKNSPSVQDRNLGTFYEELIEDKNEILERVFSNPSINYLTRDLITGQGAFESLTDRDDDSDDVDGEAEENDSTDQSTSRWEDTLGFHKKTEQHFDNEMKSILCTVPKLRDSQSENATDLNYDLDNPIGMPEFMSLQEVQNILFTRCKGCRTKEEFLNQLRLIGKYMHGCKGLLVLANQLEANPQMLIKFFSQFSKEIAIKVNVKMNSEFETKLTKGDAANKLDHNSGTGVEVTNVTARPEEALFRNYWDIAKERFTHHFSDLFGLSRAITPKEGTSLWSEYQNAKTEEEKIRICVRLMQYAIPNLSEDVYITALKGEIERAGGPVNFIRQNIPNNVQRSEDITFDDALREAHWFYSRSLRNFIEANTGRASQADELKEKAQAAYVRWQKDKENKNFKYAEADYSEYKFLLNQINELAINKPEELKQFCDFIAPYTPLAATLVHRNAKDKQTTDVMDSSMISFMMKVFRDETTTREWANSLLQSPQYTQSILLRGTNGVPGLLQTDKWGNVIYENDGLPALNPELRDMFQFRNFNGTDNSDTGTGDVKTGLSRRDYVRSLWTAFFATKGDITNADGSSGVGLGYKKRDFAIYALRTPSDSSKLWMMKAPRLDSDGSLFEEKTPETDVNTLNACLGFLNTIWANVDSSIKSELDTTGAGLISAYGHDITLKDTVFVDSSFKEDQQNLRKCALTGKGVASIHGKANKKFMKDNGDGTFTVFYNLHIKDSETNTAMADVIALKVVPTSRSRKFGEYRVIDGTVIPTRNAAINANKNASKTYQMVWANAVHNYKMQSDSEYRRSVLTVNDDSALVSALLQQATQEVINAAAALHEIFETIDVNGVTRFKITDGKLVVRDKYRNNPRLLKEKYHVAMKKTGGSPVAGELIKNGKLTGNVFHSSAFVTLVNGKQRNFGEEVWSQIFDFLNQNPNRAENDKYLECNINEWDEFGGINLTPEQTEALKKMVVDFITAKVAHEFDYLKTSMGVEDLNFKDAATFVMNYQYAYALEDEMFGSTKFFDGAQDLFKRTKEEIAGGTPYGISDYGGSLNAESKPVDLGIPEIEIPHGFDEQTGKWTQKKKLTMKSKFRAVTVQNTVRTTEDSQSEALTKKLVEGGATEEEARALQENFKKIKTNDAQSYITMEEWIKRLSALGQYDKYKDLINMLLATDENGNWLPIDQEKVTAFVQVQKNFGFQLLFDAEDGLYAPSQIKNAEFVLIPRFIKPGSDFQYIYDLMMKHSIDQLNTRETDKAGKSGVLMLWNDEGVLTQDAIDDFESSVESAGFVKEYDYRFLYKQQDTVQHMESENKAGIQVTSKITDNIERDDPRHPLKEEYDALYSTQVEESANDVMDALQVDRTEEGTLVVTAPTDGEWSVYGTRADDKTAATMDSMLGSISGLNPSLLFDMIAPHALNGGNVASDNARYFETDDFGNPTVPAWMTNFRTKIDNSVIAYVNKHVVRQTLPGFHAAQITGMGFGYTYDKKNSYFKNDDGHVAHFVYDDGFYREATAEERKSGKPCFDFKFNNLAKEGVDVVVKKYPSSDAYNKSLEEGKVEDNEVSLVKVDGKYQVYFTDDVVEQKLSDAMIPTAVTTSNRLRYHPNGEPYIEVMIPKPKALAHLSNAEALAKINELGVDQFIGYRIPTEGQQSMAVMKVVDFLDRAQGSTIAVPDDWVGQTGSDFDIDSVYAIMPNINTDADGNIYVEKYIHNPTEAQRKDMYQKYVERKLRAMDKKSTLSTFRKQINAERKAAYADMRYNAKMRIYERVRNEIESFHKEKGDKSIKELAEALPEDIKKAIEKERAAARKRNLSKGRKENLNIGQEIKARLKALDENSLDKNVKAYRERLLEFRHGINEAMEYDYVNDTLNKSKELEKQLRDSKFESTKELVKEFNSLCQQDGVNVLRGEHILSFEEFTDLPVEKQNSKEARDFAIFDLMRQMLSDPRSLVQQMQQSHFRDIINARDGIKAPDGSWIIRPCMSDAELEERKARNPYSVVTQISNNTDAVSGLELKAISVSMDNFTSVCNHVKPFNEGFTVFYPESRFTEKQLMEAFSEYETSEKTDSNGAPILKQVGVVKVDGGWLVRHNKYGWSNNNKNCLGEFITQYSSQTTAHQLDAVKEGAIMNVNKKTFGVYKLFPSMGADYVTAVSFMALPAMTEIVTRQQENDSIFNNDESYSNPVEDTAREYAMQLGVRTVDERGKPIAIGKVFEAFSSMYKNDIKRIFGYAPKKLSDVKNIPFNAELQLDRLRNEGEIFGEKDPRKLKARQALFDFITCLQYRHLSTIADAATSYNGVLKPNAFGKGVSMWKIRKLVTDAATFADEEKPKFWVNDESGEKIPIVRAVYPGLERGIAAYLSPTNTETSRYPTFNTFFKNGYVMSYLLGSKVNELNSPEFVHFLNACPRAMEDENVYNDYASYIVGAMAKQTSFAQEDDISSNELDMIRRLNGLNEHNLGEQVDVLNEDFSRVLTRDMAKHITDAIRGIRDQYAKMPEAAKSTVSLDMLIDTAIDATLENNLKSTKLSDRDKEYIRKKAKDYINFLRLSPVQKVEYIKIKYRKRGVFEYLMPNSASNRYGTSYGGRNIDTISLVQDVSSDDVVDAFKEAFNSDDAFVRETCLDLIRYVIHVEGQKFTARSINKCIPVECLEEIGYINDMNRIMADVQFAITNPSMGESMADKWVTRYVRGHWRNLKLPVMHNWQRINYETDDTVESLTRREDGAIVLSDGNNANELKTRDDKYPQFITITTHTTDGKLYQRPYKLFVSSAGITLYYPLNDLNPNETTDVSTTEGNNFYWPESLYRYDYGEALIPEMREAALIKALGEGNKSKEEAVVEFMEIQQEQARLQGVREEIIEQYLSQFARPSTEITLESETETPRLNFVSPTQRDAEATQRFHDDIERAFETTGKNTVYLRNDAINEMFRGNKSQSVAVKLNSEDSNLVLVSHKKKKATEIKFDTSKDTAEGFGSRKALISDINALDSKHEGTHEWLEVTKINSEEHTGGSSMFSAIGSIWDRSVRDMQRDALNGHENAIKSLQLLRDLGINTRETESIDQNETTVARVKADYIEARVQSLTDSFTSFYPTPQDPAKFYSIDSPELMELIKSDQALRTKFLETILGAQAIINDMRAFEGVTFEDEELQKQVNRITNAVLQLQKNPRLNNAFLQFTNQVVASWSGDPLIQTQILSLMDGFESIGWFEQWVSSSREVGNALMQIILKEFNANASAAEIEGRQKSIDFMRKAQKIREDARAAGLDIDMSKIIDESGDWVQSWDKSLKDKYEELKTALSESMATHGIGSKEHVDAKRQLDEFLLKHFNRVASDDYYREKLRLQDNFRISCPTLSYKYEGLRLRRAELCSHAVNGFLDPKYQAEVDKIDGEIFAMSSIYNNDGTLKPTIDDIFQGATPDLNSPEDCALLEQTIEWAVKLGDYVKASRKHEKNYFERVADDYFYNELAEKLDIVRKAENRDSYGHIQTSADELAQNKQYLAAKKWLEENARLQLKEDVQDLINNAFATLTGNVSGVNKNYLYGSILATRKPYTDGVVDGRLFSEDERQTIHDQLEEQMAVREQASNSTDRLIRCGVRDGIIYSEAFYAPFATQSTTSEKYRSLVRQINAILVKHYDAKIKAPKLSECSLDELKELKKLYNEISLITPRVRSKQESKRMREHMEENVDFTFDYETYNSERQRALDKHDLEFLELFDDVNSVTLIDDDGTKSLIPNSLIYGQMKPKDLQVEFVYDQETGRLSSVKGNEVFEKFVDKRRTLAIRTLNEYTERVPTSFYEEEKKRVYDESVQQGDESIYQKWYNQNHVYDPTKNEWIPLPCWTTLKYKAFDSSFASLYPEGKDNRNKNPYYYEPKYNYTSRKVKKGMENPDYKKGNTFQNYKKGSGYDISGNRKLNQYEEQMKELYQGTIAELAVDDRAKKYFDVSAPARRKKEADDLKTTAKKVLNTALSGLGLNQMPEYDETYTDDISMSNDRYMSLPMTSPLVETEPLEEIPNNATDEERAQIQARNEQRKQKAAKDKAAVIDNDWDSVMQDFINRAVQYNQLKQDRLLLYYLKHMIKQQTLYRVKADGSVDVKEVGGRTIVGTVDESQRANTLIDTVYRRRILHQFRKDQGALTRLGKRLQTWSSAKYMMFNLTGGIANVTFGAKEIMAENMLAHEYFDSKDAIWTAKRKALSAANDALLNYNSDKSNTLQGGLVKMFNVVDFDTILGLAPGKKEDSYELARNATYILQSGGEFLMQNGVMFAMLDSHRIVKDANGKWTVMTQSQYLRESDQMALEKVIANNEQLKRLWSEYKNKIENDVKLKEKFAHRKYGIVEVFVRQYMTEDKALFNEWKKNREEIRKQKAEEFFAKNPTTGEDVNPTLYSQFELSKDGFVDVNGNSKLALELKSDEVYRLLGEFREKVISVNQKIHGVYDKFGAAKIEEQWWGGLVMQYHKHIWPGIMKRFRRKGYYNETRGSFELGCYTQLWNFLKIEFTRDNFIGVPEESLNTTKSIQNYFKAAYATIVNWNTNWNTMSDEERGNMKRCLGDIYGFLAAVAATIAIKLTFGGDDDDDEQGLLYNLALYEADRLASESLMYIMPWSEASKLWASPVAVGAGISDVLSSMGIISAMILQGSDYDPTYRSGVNKGENKIKIQLLRQFPIYRSTKHLLSIIKNNKYYKLSTNWNQIFASKAVDIIKNNEE